MSDLNIRDPETGQFRSTTREDVATQYVEEQYGVALSRLVSIYDDVMESRVGRWLFA